MTNPNWYADQILFARSVDEAIRRPAKSWAEDAMLLNTRKFASSGDQPGGYEVVFGVGGETVPAPAARP